MRLTAKKYEGDVGSITLVESADNIQKPSMLPTSAEDTEMTSQKRRSARSVAGTVKKAKKTGDDNGQSTSITVPPVPPRTSRRATTRIVPSKPGSEVAPRRTASRRVPETWSAQHLLSNPKSKLAHCNLNVITDNSIAIPELTGVGFDKSMPLGPPLTGRPS